MGRPRKETPKQETARILREAMPNAARTLIDIMEDAQTAAGTRAAIAQQIIAKGIPDGIGEESQAQQNFELTLNVVE